MQHIEPSPRWTREPILGAAQQPASAFAARRARIEQDSQDDYDTCVVTTATGAYDSNSTAGKAILQNKLEFCSACGYRCIVHTRGEHTTNRPHKWDKLLVLHDALRTCRVALYVDADVVFRRAFQLRPLARSWLSASRDFVGLNSGVMLMVRSEQARALLT